MEEKEEENSRVVTQDKEQHEPPNQPGAAGDAQAAALPLIPLAHLRHLDFDLSRCRHSHHRLPQPHNVLLDLLPQRHNPHSRESFALSLFSLIFEFFTALLACSVAGVRVFLPQPACSSEKAATHRQSSHCQCATPTFSVLMAICGLSCPQSAWSWSELQTTSQLWALPPSLRQQLRRRWWWGVVRSSRKGGSSGLPDVHCRPHRPPPQPQWPPTCSPTHQSAQPVRQPTLSKCQQHILYLCRSLS